MFLSIATYNYSSDQLAKPDNFVTYIFQRRVSKCVILKKNQFYQSNNDVLDVYVFQTLLNRIFFI